MRGSPDGHGWPDEWARTRPAPPKPTGTATTLSVRLKKSAALSRTQKHRNLWRSIIELPDLDLSLVVPLPTLISPELEQLLQAALNDDPDTAEELIPTVLETIDTPHQRAQLARAILNLRDAGKLSTRHAAAAIIDLAGETHTLLRASLLNAIFIKTGHMQTPGGLRIAA